MLDSIKKAVLRLFPELSAGLHLDRYARVTAVNDMPLKGSASERFRARYSVDLTILTPALEPDPAYPVYSSVPLPVPYAAGEESGIFAPPQRGALAVIGFAYGRPEHPIIRQIYPLGASLPHVGAGELVLQQGPDVFARADDAGNWQREARFAIAEKSQNREIEALNYIVNAASELKKIRQHSITEVEGISRLEAALVDILGAIKVDVGTLGELNLTAGADSTLSTAGNHTQTIGGTRFNVTKGDDVESIDGSAEQNIGGDSLVNITGGLTFESGADVMATVGGMVQADITTDLTATIGGNETLTITGNHTLSAAASTEAITGAKTITAGGAATLAGSTATLAGAVAAIAVGATIVMTGQSPSGESVSIMDELVGCLDNIIKAESELAKGTSTASGSPIGNPTPYINAARAHWNKIKSVN